MIELTAPIVGMHFRPPAKEVIQLLPAGTKLHLRRQPDNEYDEFAVQVFLPGFCEGGEAQDTFRVILEDGGYGEELLTDPLHLGFVDSKKTGMAKIFSEAMLEAQDDPSTEVIFLGWLGFSMDGKPTVVTHLTVAEPTSAEPIPAEPASAAAV